MSITHTITRQYKDQSTTAIQLAETITSDFEKNIDKSVSIGTDVLLSTIALTQANLKSVCISCDVDCTLKTNSSGSPQDTISIKAGQVLIWSLAIDAIGRCPFSNNVTAIYMTNAALAAIKIRVLHS